jgi:histidyl-tRNA synthetase
MERLPGFRDFYPAPTPHPDAWSADTRNYIFDRWRSAARRYGFREYDGPPLEPLELYTTKSGEEIVGQLYNFVDKGDRTVALRPEMTPTLARMVGAHERHYKKPIKWFAIPQLFRYERQQRGRLREHFQFNADIFGETDPGADAELIALLIDVLRAFGLTADDFVVRISSRQVWRQKLEGLGLTDPARFGRVYQAIDKLAREPLEATRTKLAEAGLSDPQIQTVLDTATVKEDRPTEFKQVPFDVGEVLSRLPKTLHPFCEANFSVVRGLAYYTGTVFEAFDRKGEFRAIAGGGRYNHLVKLMTGGKVDLPGLGFGMGDVVLTELLRARGLLPAVAATLDVFTVIDDEALRSESLDLVQTLRGAGLAVDYALTPAKPDKQLKRALEANAACTLQLRKTDTGELTVKIRDLRSREEKTVPRQELVEALRRLLAAG